MDGDGLTWMVDHKGIGSLLVEGLEMNGHTHVDQDVALYGCRVMEESV